MLHATDVAVAYDQRQVLWGVSVQIGYDEVVCLLGPNGAGKSTLVNAISGLVPMMSGSIRFLDTQIERLPTYRRIEAGIAHVLERRRVFPYMTVLENLRLGAYSPSARLYWRQTLDWVLTLFPRLRERLGQQAWSLSGGEQQQLAIARGLMCKPKLLIIDEPYLGLQPSVMNEISEVLRSINRNEHVSVLFVEQNVQKALEWSDRGYVLEAGQVVLEGKSAELLADSRIQEVYLGI